MPDLDQKPKMKKSKNDCQINFKFEINFLPDLKIFVA